MNGRFEVQRLEMDAEQMQSRTCAAQEQTATVVGEWLSKLGEPCADGSAIPPSFNWIREAMGLPV